VLRIAIVRISEQVPDPQPEIMLQYDLAAELIASLMDLHPPANGRMAQRTFARRVSEIKELTTQLETRMQNHTIKVV
jgi:hypothetical protein